MAGNVPTDTAGRHGVNGSAPAYERSWDPERVHLLSVAQLVVLLESEIAAIMTRCNTGFCQAALMVRTRPDEAHKAFTQGHDIPDLLFCPQCGVCYFKKAVVELRPILKALGGKLDHRAAEIKEETRTRLATLWYRGTS